MIIPSLSGVDMIYKHKYWNGESIPKVLHVVNRMIISGFFCFPPFPSVWVLIPSVMRDWRGWWRVWNHKQSYEPLGEWEGDFWGLMKTLWRHNPSLCTWRSSGEPWPPLWTFGWTLYFTCVQRGEWKGQLVLGGGSLGWMKREWGTMIDAPLVWMINGFT